MSALADRASRGGRRRGVGWRLLPAPDLGGHVQQELAPREAPTQGLFDIEPRIIEEFQFALGQANVECAHTVGR